MLEFCSHEALVMYNVKFRRFFDCLFHWAVVPISIQSVSKFDARPGPSLPLNYFLRVRAIN
jgi:hypothetical protein